MQKVYKASRWQILFIPLFLFGGGLAMLLFEDEFIYRSGGIIASLMSIYIFRVLNNTKIIIDEKYLISENYLSSFRCQQIKMEWSEIKEIYTSSDTPVMRILTTYVISDVERGKNKENIIKIASFMKNYRELITEISKKSHNASIDEETKKVIGK